MTTRNHGRPPQARTIHLGLILALHVALSFLIAGPAFAQSAAESTAAPTLGGVQTPQPVTLETDDIERFIATMGKLKNLGVNVAEQSQSDPTGMTEMNTALQANADAVLVLEDNGFDITSFQRVGYSVMVAYAADELENADAEISMAKQQLAALKGQMSPEQYAMIERQMLGATSMLENQPPGNVDVVRPYKRQIDAVMY
jgi:hypothetical protein